MIGEYHDGVREALRQVREECRKLLKDYFDAKTAPVGTVKPAVMPVAWLHTMDNTEELPENEPFKMLSFSKDNPFGVAGVNYSETFPVTSEPLYKQHNQKD